MEQNEEYFELLCIIKSLKQFDFTCISNIYIDKNYWVDKIEKHFPRMFIENQTSFDYSRCFSYAINISNTNANLLSDEFDKYIKINGALFRMVLKISLLGPYIWYSYCKYEYSEKTKRVEMYQKKQLFIEEHAKFNIYLNNFIEMNKLKIISESVNEMIVPDVTLELIEDDTRISDIFFDV